MSAPTPAPSLEAGLSSRLFAVTAFAMLIAATLSMAVTLAEFNAGLRPFLLAKAERISLKVKSDIEYALSIGVPADKLRGVEAFLDQLNTQNPEISRLDIIPADPSILDRPDRAAPPAEEPAAASEFFAALADAGAIIAGASDTPRVVSSDIVQDGRVIARVEATLDERFITEQMQSVFFDTLVIMIAVGLVALEVVVVFFSHRITEPLRRADDALRRRAAGDLAQYNAPIRQGAVHDLLSRLNAINRHLRDRAHGVADRARAAASALGGHVTRFVADRHLDQADPARRPSLVDARIPLFVFCVAEELQKSFLPLFVSEYYLPSDLFDKSIMVGLPISAFMFVIAALTPFAGRLVDKYGNRRLFLVGLLPAIAGYVGCFLAQSGNDIVLWRSVTAAGYAVVTIASQSYIAAVVPRENRARGMAVFVGVLMAGTMCGTAIGGILADWIGHKPVFLIAAGLASVAGWLGYFMLSAEVADRPAVAAGARRGGAMATLMKNSRFLLIVLFCAIPTKIILTGFLYLFVPLYLASLDATQSEIGRVMMVYSLIIIPISPLASRFADRLGRNLTVVIVATVLSGIVLIGLYQSASVAAVLMVVAALGVVHSFIKAPLIVAAMEAAETSPGITRTGALSVLRTSERIGSVIGPVIVAAMLVRLDFGQTAALLGAGVALIGAAMAVTSLTWRAEPRGV